MTTQDPRQHLLSRRRHLWDASGAAVSQPISFAEAASAQRGDLSNALEDPIANVSGVEALVSAMLLEEFAARLRNDVEQGTVAADAEELAQVATDLAKRLSIAGGIG
ncbi:MULTISPECIES: hypothetical protein [unclassified Streptomyces]|uniref:hypothetical protein n=1 Tax=unclassified Streptomyces TaxID=2593676 RepID=UPI0029AE6573|nr:hypothetical protein [Streptomyces sp. DK15]MDX2394929.1 hypothetical protein [Streptomyces sp. DK15]